jgi:hypothetical protein
VYLNSTTILLAKKQNADLMLVAGDYSLPFELQLPSNLPASLRAHYGDITYEIIAKIDIPWTLFDKKTMISFDVKNQVNLNALANLKLPYGLSETKILGINEIYMITEQNGNIYFDINNIKLDNSDDNISYIENKPIHLIFIIIYLINNNLLKTNISSKKDFMYSYDDNNNLVLYKKDDNNNLISSMTLAINNLDNNHIKNTCHELFKSSPETQECSKHFYSILGKSAISMIINLKEQISSKDNIISNLLNANPSIQYEIIQNLNWNFKMNEKGINELITVDEWLEKLTEQKKIYIELLN